MALDIKRPVLLALGLALAAGCSEAPRGGGEDAGEPADAADRDAPTGDAGEARDAGGRDGSEPDGGTDAGRTDAGGSDAGRDAGADDAGGGGGLDPDLATADAGGTPCTTPGSLAECASASVCRFFSASEGRCGSCDACGNLGDSCTTPRDCDILFACFRGECTNYCTLGSTECGAVADCLDVGHPDRGVCRP